MAQFVLTEVARSDAAGARVDTPGARAVEVSASRMGTQAGGAEVGYTGARVGRGEGERTDRRDDQRGDEYAYLTPLLTEYAQLEASDPRRAGLRERLVAGYLPVARHIARRFGNRGEPLEDLIQVATLGLIFAVDRFRADLGSDFLAFAIPTIQGEVRRHFRDRGWSVRVSRRLKDLHVSINSAVTDLSQRLGRAPRPSEIAEHLDISATAVLEGLEASTAYRPNSLDEELRADTDGSGTLADQLGEPDPGLELVEDHHALRPLLEALPERERSILMMRFYGNMTQTQIGAHLGISQMHVSRLLTQTLARLRERLRDEQ